MELGEILGGLPTTLVLPALLLWLWNQATLKWMAERKELAEAIAAERKEWLQERRDMLERQFTLDERLVTELAQTRGENHAMRGELTKFILRLEGYFTGRTGKTDG